MVTGLGRDEAPDSPHGIYALVLEAEGFEFLMDTRELWKPPRVLVRGGRVEAEIWLDEDNVSFMKEPGLGARDEARILGWCTSTSTT